MVVYGTVCLDRIHLVPRLPKQGGYVEVERTVETVGGEAWNTAFALVLWRHDARLVSNSLGSGPLKEMIAESPVPAPVRLDTDHPCPVCDIYVTPNGSRTMFGEGFAKMEERSSVDGLDLDGAAWMTADPNLGKTSTDALQAAADHGAMRYLMDFGPDADYLPGDFWQSSTDRFGKVGDIQANIRWLEKFVKDKQVYAVLSDGANGFVAGGSQMEVRHFPPYPAPEIVDSTGAGDAFRAGMLHGLDLGWNLGKCLGFASAAGSLTCREIGATAGLPTEAEALAHMDSYPHVTHMIEEGAS